MQTTCSQCAQMIVVDDAKLPAGPFMLRCPKCQATMKMPGKEAAKSSPPPPTPKPPAPVRNAPPAPPARQPQPAQPAPSLPAPKPVERAEAGNGSFRALMSLADSTEAQAVQSLLCRMDCAVVPLDIWEEKVEELLQGRYDIVIAHRNGNASNGERDLYQLVNTLTPEIRRRIFLVLVGKEFKTGNGTQAFVTLSDFVFNPQDTDSSDVVFRSTLAERTRFFRTLLEVENS